MAGNSFGVLFTVSTFGESHGPAVGCLVDGCPAGLSLNAGDIERDLMRRRPGGEGPVSGRREADRPEILSGVYRGKTLGTPIAIVIPNRDQRPEDYETLKDTYRPGHADWTWEAKYGIRDHRGGGRSSGRETAGRVAGGAVARVFLESCGISIKGWVSAIAGIVIPGPEEAGFDYGETERNPFRIARKDFVQKAGARLEDLRNRGDSAGGKVSISVTGLPPGLGEPVFGKLDALIASAMLSIGAVKGVEFGAGFAAASMTGSGNNDVPVLPPGSSPAPSFKTNRAGGVLGGISTGMPLEFTIAVKPTASIPVKQESVDRRGETLELEIPGRHDLCIAPRLVPVAEAMTALVLADLTLLRRCNKAEVRTRRFS
jgi:chorismate synthase